MSIRCMGGSQEKYVRTLFDWLMKTVASQMVAFCDKSDIIFFCEKDDTKGRCSHFMSSSMN